MGTHLPQQADYIPRRYHEQQVDALTDRCVATETALIQLLDFIDDDILDRNGCDWLRAVQELMQPPQTPEPRKKVKK